MNDWKAKEAARASAAKALQAAFPGLVPASDKVDSLNAAAKNMRIELKAAFPGVKFSVKSSRFSGGDSISVSWIDGPNGDQVDAIIDRYSAGSFDGMTDCYNYSRDAWTDAFGSAKYVSGSRAFSDKAIESAIRTVMAKYAANLERDGIKAVAVDDYRNNRLWNVDLLRAGYGNRGDLQSLISEVLYKRTWALTRVARPFFKSEEVA